MKKISPLPYGRQADETPPLVTNNTALQYLTNTTKEKKPDGSVEIKEHIKDAWQKDPILSRIEVFQNLSNQLAPQKGSKRARILLKKRRKHRRNHKQNTAKLQNRARLYMLKGHRKTNNKIAKGNHVMKRTKYLDISLKLAKQDEGSKEEDKSEYQVNLVPKAPEHEASESRQPMVPNEYHFTQVIPGTDHHHPFHYEPLYPGLQPAPPVAPAPEMPPMPPPPPPPPPEQPIVQHIMEPIHTEVHHEEVHTPAIHVPAQSSGPVCPMCPHHETGELQDEVNKLMRESEALKMTAARFESKAKELANQAEILHQETVSSDGHMGQTEGVRADHTPIEVHDQHGLAMVHAPVIHTPICADKQSAHIQVQADYPVYNIPCKTQDQPIVEYHRPEPPPEGVNPYEILTSDMLNEENYKPQLRHQRHKILPKSWRNKKKKRSRGKKHDSYVMTIKYGR